MVFGGDSYVAVCCVCVWIVLWYVWWMEEGRMMMVVVVVTEDTNDGREILFVRCPLKITLRLGGNKSR